MHATPHYLRLGRALALGALALTPGCIREAQADRAAPPAPPCPAEQPTNAAVCPQLGQRCSYYERGVRPPPQTECVCTPTRGSSAWSCSRVIPSYPQRGPLAPPELGA